MAAPPMLFAVVSASVEHDVARGDPGALLGQALGDGPADAPPGPGDQRAPAVESSHEHSP